MDTMTLKIPDILKEKIKNYSKRNGLSKSEIVREALIQYFDKNDIKKKVHF